MSEDNVIPFANKAFDGIKNTSSNLTPDEILQNASGQLDGVLILGRMNGTVEYYSHSGLDSCDMLWLLERAKQQLLSQFD